MGYKGLFNIVLDDFYLLKMCVYIDVWNFLNLIIFFIYSFLMNDLKKIYFEINILKMCVFDCFFFLVNMLKMLFWWYYIFFYRKYILIKSINKIV